MTFFFIPSSMLLWLRRNWRDTAFLAAFVAVFATPLRLPVLGFVQRGVLATGLLQPPLPAQPTQAAPSAGLPDVPLYTLAGQATNLRRLRGKVVLANVWASWCPPCRAEMPGLQALYARTDTAKVAFVCISLDENPAQARAFLKKQGYSLPVYLPAAPLPAPLASASIPYTVIFAPDGQVAARHAGMADYDTPEFRAALAQLAQ